MAEGIVSAFVLLLTAIVAFMNRRARINEEKRKLAEEAKKRLEDGLEKDNTDDITGSFDRINRL